MPHSAGKFLNIEIKLDELVEVQLEVPKGEEHAAALAVCRAEVDPHQAVVVGWVGQGLLLASGSAVLLDEEVAGVAGEGEDALGNEGVGRNGADVLCCFGEVGFRIPKLRLLERHKSKQLWHPDFFNLVHPVEKA